MFWLNFVILLNMKSVIKNISKLIQCDSNDIKFRAGNEMNSLETISNAFLEIENGLITDFGDMDQWKGIDDWNNTEIIDAENGMVFPSYCDSHTHLVFAQSRESEFNDRINGSNMIVSIEKLSIIFITLIVVGILMVMLSTYSSVNRYLGSTLDDLYN